MNQIGDTFSFELLPVPSGSAIYSYVWKWWDGTQEATTAPFVTKVINSGGQPGTGELHYTCQPVARDGQSALFAGTLTANNPPVFLPGASLSNNDDYFAYQTRLTVQAFDLDGGTCAFNWYTGTTFLGNGTSTVFGTVNGTWRGNDTVVVTSCSGTENYLDLTVLSARTVTCYAVDNQNGTSTVEFSLRGRSNPTPVASLTVGVAGVAFDATAPPSARIGVDQQVDLSVYVAPLPNHAVDFSWSFAGTNGWTMPPVVETGTVAALPNGGLQNTVYRDISAETVASGTAKTVLADVRVTATNSLSGEVSYTTAQYALTLIANSAPSSVTIVRSVGGVAISGAGPVAAGALIEYAAAGTDADADVLDYRWQFAQPSPLTTNPLYLWGPKVLYDTTGYGAASSVEGQLLITDRLGATLTVLLPSTSVV